MSETSRPGRLERPIQSLASGRYVISGVLGAGGMATVFRAFDSRLELYRAVKVLNPELVSSVSLRKRFEMEARTMARLHHPNIVSVMDIGVEDELAYMVMELLEGGSLNDRIKNVGYLPPRTGLTAIQAILSALVLAHSKGVIHRDIKPHNVLLTADGVIKLTDFGIAHLIGQDRALTASNAVIGTWAFMAPEQRKSSRRVSVATDIYSVGATLYALLTARDPFDIYNKELQKELFAGIPEPIVEIIERATRYYSDERYASAAEMLSAVQRVDAALRPDFIDAPNRATSVAALALPAPPEPGPLRVFEGGAHPTLSATGHATPIPVPSPTLFPLGDPTPPATTTESAPTIPGLARIAHEEPPGIDPDEEPTPFDVLRQQGDPGERLRRAALRNAAPPAPGGLGDPVTPGAERAVSPSAVRSRAKAERPQLRHFLLGLGAERWLLLAAPLLVLVWIAVWLALRTQPSPPAPAVGGTAASPPTTTPTAAASAAPPSAPPTSAPSPTPAAAPVAPPTNAPSPTPSATTSTVPAASPAPVETPAASTPRQQDARDRLRALPGQ